MSDASSGIWYGLNANVDLLVEEECHTPETQPIRSLGRTPRHFALGASVLEPKIEEEVVSKGLLKSAVAPTSERLARRSLARSLEQAIARRPSREDVLDTGILREEPEPQDGTWQYEMASATWQATYDPEGKRWGTANIGSGCDSPRRLALQFGYAYAADEGQVGADLYWSTADYF